MTSPTGGRATNTTAASGELASPTATIREGQAGRLPLGAAAQNKGTPGRYLRGGSLSGPAGSCRPLRRGSQYTSGAYRAAVEQCGIRQSMNSDGGHCHDNASCESMWARMKSELSYNRLNTERLTVEELKTLIWRYFMSYWNRRRICSAETVPRIV